MRWDRRQSLTTTTSAVSSCWRFRSPVCIASTSRPPSWMRTGTCGRRGRARRWAWSRTTNKSRGSNSSSLLTDPDRPPTTSDLDPDRPPTTSDLDPGRPPTTSDLDAQFVPRVQFHSDYGLKRLGFLTMHWHCVRTRFNARITVSDPSTLYGLVLLESRRKWERPPTTSELDVTRKAVTCSSCRVKDWQCISIVSN